MSIVDPQLPLADQVERQHKVIEALMRRSNRQNEMGLSPYSAFQSAIELQDQVAAQSRDLRAAANELEELRQEQLRTSASLDDALAAMESGIALFFEGALVLCNDLFRSLLPDISADLVPGLSLEHYFGLVAESGHLVRIDQRRMLDASGLGQGGASVLSMVMELTGDCWFQLNAQRMGSDRVVLSATEITAIVRQGRVERESLIDAQSAYLQAMFENMTSGVCTLSEDGSVRMFNGPFRELLGLPFTALQKGNSIDWLLGYIDQHGLLASHAVRALRAWLQEPPDARDVLRIRAEQGSQKVLDLNATHLPDGSLLLELKDVTLESQTTADLEARVHDRTAELTEANKRLTHQHAVQAMVEEELRLAKERAEVAVSSKTRFLAAASHDLLQPINAAKLLLSNLLRSTGGTDYHDSVVRLNRSFGSVEQLLQSLLDISRLEGDAGESLRPTEVCLSDIMRGIIDDQRAMAEQKHLRIRVVPSGAYVRTDPVFLLRSLQNLVVNAIQYNQPGGEVLVGCRLRGDKVVLQVWDTGRGIPYEDQDRIFEEFNRGSRSDGQGAGLGLSVVEHACRQLGHRLWLQSTPGRGSLFCIEMDRCEPTDPPSLEESDLAVPGNAGLDLIALVIENDEDLLFATTQTLEQWGAVALPVKSIAEALRHVRDMGIPPDIILADYQLDDNENGFDAIRAVRDLTRTQVPAIMITASHSEHLITMGHRMQVAVMTKPVQVSRLRPLIEWKVAHAGEVEKTPLRAIAEAPTKVAHDRPAKGSRLTGGRTVT